MRAASLLVVALVHHCDDRPIAAMAGRIIAAELGRIEPRRHASVEKEGIPAAEAVAGKTGEVVKVHPVFDDDEIRLQTPKKPLEKAAQAL